MHNFHKRTGDLPVFLSGPNKGRLDRAAVAEQRGLTYAGVGKVYNNWSMVFRIEGSTLTFVDYLDKLVEAGINPEDVGPAKGLYHLARYGDIGPYTVKTCRFILAKENRAEQKDVPIFELSVKKHGIERARQIASENGYKGGKAIAGIPRNRARRQEVKGTAL